ncbi:MAG: hypothetical protein FWG77_11565 [Treponema sp.]|nr:hypothetical protein [Treponema sp.]
MKTYKKTLIGIVMILGLVLSSCLDVSDIESGWVLPPLSGHFSFTDETSAALVIMNWSGTVNVTNVVITEDNGPDSPPIVSFTNRPRARERRAVYLRPNEKLYRVVVSYTVGDNPEVHSRTFSGPSRDPGILLLFARDIAYMHIFRNAAGEVEIIVTPGDTEIPTTPPPGHDPDDSGIPVDDPYLGEGSVPGVIPEGRENRLGIVVIINMTNSENIHGVNFVMGDRDYTMGRVNARDRQSIALGGGSWATTLSYGVNGASSIGPRNIIVVPSSHPQASQEHYMYFYRNNRGGYDITNTWPPSDQHPDDILPIDAGHGRGLIKITNNTTSLVTSVLINNRRNPERVGMFLDSETGAGNPFSPPIPVQFNQVGFVDVVGTQAFPIEAHGEYLITVYLVHPEGEASFERLAYIKDQVVEIVINNFTLKKGAGGGNGDEEPPSPKPNGDDIKDGDCTCSDESCLCKYTGDGKCSCEKNGGCQCGKPAVPSNCDCGIDGIDCKCLIECKCVPKATPEPECPCGVSVCTCTVECKCNKDDPTLDGPNGPGCACPPPPALPDCQKPGGTCTCVANFGKCNCKPGDTCPVVVIPEPPSGIYGFNRSRNTLITTGLALRNGRVMVWGYRGSGQQGNGANVVSDENPPTIVNSLSNIQVVTGSAYTLVAIDGNGTAWGWGQNLHGAAGVGSSDIPVNTPRRVSISVPVDQVAAGEYFFIARGTDGSVWTWGQNTFGQIGVGTGDRPVPVKVNLAGETARLIGASYEGAFAVTDQGNVWAWGRNASNSLGIAGGDATRLPPQRVPSLQQYATRITHIAGGYRHGHALLSDGTIIGWGQNDRLGGAIGGLATSRNHNPVPIVPGILFDQMHSRFISTVALARNGDVYTWGTEGYNIGGSRVIRNTAADVKDIGGGKHSVFYRTGDNLVRGVGWGDIRTLNLNNNNNQNWPGIRVNLPTNTP